jgi:hypothetical protein
VFPSEDWLQSMRPSAGNHNLIFKE